MPAETPLHGGEPQWLSREPPWFLEDTPTIARRPRSGYFGQLCLTTVVPSSRRDVISLSDMVMSR
ncbi:hypothetical protein TanjilG_25800 [Lupinus angustifolius]|uniref:Uncharacterized protein n=1 Tax=Lupinus angustifolius TaxID=3871 RepID=A0A1J7HGA6_LUPAN|nr:hypothetical protein TanjilG_25800 [Lupinus angustifolius]